jgi:hypothetical protein
LEVASWGYVRRGGVIELADAMEMCALFLS